MLRTCKECELGVEVKRRICWASLLLIRHSGKKKQRQTIHQSRLESRESPQLRQGHRPGSGIGMEPSPRQEELTTRSPLQPPSEHDVLSVLSSSASVSVAPRRLQQRARPGLLDLGRGKFGRQFIADQSSSPQTWNSDLRHNANTNDIAGDGAACLEADASKRIAVASCPSRRHRLRQNQGRQTDSPPAGRGQRRGRVGANRQLPPPDGVDPVAAGSPFPAAGWGPSGTRPS